MKLSVIVPFYNMARDNIINHCLDSILNQTIDHNAYEIIAVDDCSTDDTLQILRTYESDNPGRVIVIACEKNGKQGAAKNRGLAIARGEWISFIDGDDWIAPNYYEELFKAADEIGADMAGCDYAMVDHYTFDDIIKAVPNNDMSQAGILDDKKRASLILDTGSLAVKIFKREIVFGAGDPREGNAVGAEDDKAACNPVTGGIFPEGMFYEDNAVAADFVLRAKSFAYVNKALYFYYQHPGSTVHVINDKKLDDRIDSGEIMLSSLKKDEYMDAYGDEIEFRFTNLFYINTLFSVMSDKCDFKGTGKFKTRKAMCAYLRERMMAEFSRFRENPYYRERTDAEQKKLIDMHMASNMKFFVYYSLLMTYRKIRYGKA